MTIHKKDPTGLPAYGRGGVARRAAPPAPQKNSPKMTDIETWTSDKGHEELHHFLDGDPTTYVWGINRRLLGDDAYGAMRMIVLERLEQLKLLSQLQSVPSLSQLTSTP